MKSMHENILEDFQKLMRYCCMDVLLTYHLYRNLFPLFQGKNPSWSSFYGMLKMSSAVNINQSINQPLSAQLLFLVFANEPQMDGIYQDL